MHRCEAAGSFNAYGPGGASWPTVPMRIGGLALSRGDLNESPANFNVVLRLDDGLIEAAYGAGPRYWLRRVVAPKPYSSLAYAYLAWL